jgi:hypothetical protein
MGGGKLFALLGEKCQGVNHYKKNVLLVSTTGSKQGAKVRLNGTWNVDCCIILSSYFCEILKVRIQLARVFKKY